MRGLAVREMQMVEVESGHPLPRGPWKGMPCAGGWKAPAAHIVLFFRVLCVRSGPPAWRMENAEKADSRREA